MKQIMMFILLLLLPIMSVNIAFDNLNTTDLDAQVMNVEQLDTDTTTDMSINYINIEHTLELFTIVKLSGIDSRTGLNNKYNIIKKAESSISAGSYTRIL